MVVVGWLTVVCLSLMGLLFIILLAIPAAVSYIKLVPYKTKLLFENKKDDADRRSEERQLRYDAKRQKDFELANAKLDVRFGKTNQKILAQKAKCAGLPESTSTEDSEE